MTAVMRVAHGLWRPIAEVAEPVDRIAALLSVLPVGTVVAGTAAARLHGLWLPEEAVDEPVEVILRGHVDDQESHAGCRHRQIRGRRRRLPADEIVAVGGLTATSVARTWVDLAESMSAPDLLAAGDSALRGDTTIAHLACMTRRAAGRRGVIRARAVLPLLDARSRSRPESHLRYALVSRGLPIPEVNVAIYSAHGEWLAEPDLSYDDVKLALEYNGADHAEVRRMRRDITREIDMDSRGRWRTLTFGPSEVFGHPDQVAQYVSRVRAERSGELPPVRRLVR